MPVRRTDVWQRLLKRRRIDEKGCWVADSKSDNGAGYKYISVGGKRGRKVYAHRLALARSNAPSAVNARKTHCPKGHELAGENLYVKPSDRKRSCRRCHADQMRARRAEQRRIG